MKGDRLIIIGAGNVGGFLSYNIRSFGEYDVLGFLDDDPNKQGKKLYGHTVIGKVDDLSAFLTEKPLKIVIGISSPKAKSLITAKVAKYNVEFPNFIGEKVWLSEKVSIGKGVILYPGTSVNYESVLGDFVIVNMNCAIGHNCCIGDYATLAPGVNLAGFTVIEDGVTIGVGASSRQGIRIGRESVVGGQSMLVSDVPERTVVAGVPGRILTK